MLKLCKLNSVFLICYVLFISSIEKLYYIALLYLFWSWYFVFLFDFIIIFIQWSHLLFALSNINNNNFVTVFTFPFHLFVIIHLDSFVCHSTWQTKKKIRPFDSLLSLMNEDKFNKKRPFTADYMYYYCSAFAVQCATFFGVEIKGMCNWCWWLMANDDSFESKDLTWLLITTVDVVDVVLRVTCYASSRMSFSNNNLFVLFFWLTSCSILIKTISIKTNGVFIVYCAFSPFTNFEVKKIIVNVCLLHPVSSEWKK